MTYDVQIASDALQQLNDAVEWYVENASTEIAQNWYHGFLTAINTLADSPFSHPIALENYRFEFEVRNLLYGRSKNFRALYSVVDNKIIVFNIRHSSQDEYLPDQ